MAHQGEDLYRVSRWMGHSTIAITADLYTHLFVDEDAALQSRLSAAFVTSHTPTRRSCLCLTDEAEPPRQPSSNWPQWRQAEP